MTSSPFLLAIALGTLTCGGCARHQPAAADNAAQAEVDIDRAAREAQQSVDAYGENVAADAAKAARPTTAVLAPPPPGTPGGLPDDRTAMPETPLTPDSAQGAANVVQRYYALIGERAYVKARALWTPGASGAGSSDAGFANGFARYSEYHAIVGVPGAIDAGAGQRYVTVPVRISGRLKARGTRVYEIGHATLHRTDVAGATADQRRWRLQSVELKPAPERR